MKVMHVIDSAGIYGAEVMLLNLMEEHQTMGLSPMLLSLEPPDHPTGISLSEEALKRKLSAVKYPLRRGYSWAGSLDIIRFAEKQGVSLIHSHGYKGNILLGAVPRFMRKIPVISTVHGWTSVQRFTKIWFYVLLDKFFLKRLDAIVNVNSTTVMSAGAAEKFIVENGIPPLKFVDRDSIAEGDRFLSEFCGKGFILGTISRLSDEKGIGYLIEAVGALVAKGADVKALVIGEGPEKESLQKFILSRQLSDRILLAGYRNNAFNYLPLFNLFVLPSLTEGLPITLLEAMQAGVPVVATNVGGIPEVLGKGNYGILVEPGDPEALAAAIARLFSDTESAERMAREAKKRALSEYTSRRMAEKYLHVYESVLRGWKR